MDIGRRAISKRLGRALTASRASREAPRARRAPRRNYSVFRYCPSGHPCRGTGALPCCGAQLVSHGKDAGIVFPAHPVGYDKHVMMDKNVERIVRKGDQAAEQRIDPYRALEEIWLLSLRPFTGKLGVVQTATSATLLGRSASAYQCTPASYEKSYPKPRLHPGAAW